MKSNLSVELQKMARNSGLRTSEYLKWMLACKPEWATGINYRGALKVGTQLCTKDGRITGNACIIGTKAETGSFVVRTDAGNCMTVSASEIGRMFWIGVYYLKVKRK